MKWYEGAKILSREEFRRQKGVYPETFDKMIEILQAAQKQKKLHGGRPNKLKIEDMLMMALEYWREYRTYFHIGLDYGLSESNTYQTIKWIEHVLNKKSKNKPVTKEDKIYNRAVSSERIGNENAIGFIKRFRIVSERYRNRRKRFGLRFTLVAGICNFELCNF